MRESLILGEGGQVGEQLKGERVRDARLPEPSGCPSTGELIDTETVTISSERGRWKSACEGNSLAAYSTARPVREGAVGNLRKPVAPVVRRRESQQGAGRLLHRLRT